jgi:hypothetical protein
MTDARKPIQLLLCAAALATTAVAVAASAPRGPHRTQGCVVPGTSRALDRSWRPDTGAAVRYSLARGGDISFAVRTAHRFYGYRADRVVPSASVVKAMLMVAYLDLPAVRSRRLSPSDFSLLVPMVTQSDDHAASRIADIVGPGAVAAVAGAARMTHFAYTRPWGLTQITARDQTKLFLHLDAFVAPAHRWYALHLLASIVPSQRWGVARAAPRGWRLYFKGGWGSGSGAIDHQVALLTRGCARLAVAVMTLGDGSHPYGQQTLRGIFARLLRRLPY